MKLTRLVPIVAALLADASAMAGEEVQKNVTPTEAQPLNPWSFALSLPAWIPWQSGETGINGKTSHVRLGPNDLIPKIDMVAGVRAEAHYQRFGLMGEYSYMSLSDGIGTPGLVKKLDVRMDQTMTELAVSYRLVQGERGWLDVFAGARYTNLYQAAGLHPDSGAIQSASENLVDAVASRIAVGAKEQIGTLVKQQISNKLESLAPRNPTLPEGPIADALRDIVSQKVKALIQQRVAALQTAILSKVPSRVADAKAKLSNEIAHAVTDKLNTKISRTDDWVDPFVGLRARYYLTKAIYLTGRTDFGGFGVGSEFSYQLNAGVGCQVTRNIFVETTYRLYDINYRHDGLTYDMLTHGIELSTGIAF